MKHKRCRFVLFVITGCIWLLLVIVVNNKPMLISKSRIMRPFKRLRWQFQSTYSQSLNHTGQREHMQWREDSEISNANKDTTNKILPREDFDTSAKSSSTLSPMENKGKENANLEITLDKTANISTPLNASKGNESSLILGNNNSEERGESMGVLTITEFSYLMNPRTICPPGVHLSYVVCVFSTPGNFEAREELRQTWAAPDLLVGHPSRLVFIMGRPSEDRLLLQLQNESRIHGDIVMEDFVAAYENLTYSSIAALRWVTYHCPNVSYVIKADDDVYVNIFKLVHILYTDYRNESWFFLCAAHHNAVIKRQCVGNVKFCLPNHILPNRTHYPTYCAGPAYIFPKTVAVEIYNATRRITPFIVEDVYITGILRETINVSLHSIQYGSSLLLLSGDVLKIVQQGGVFPDTFIIHDLQHRQGLKPRLLADNINRLPPGLRSMVSPEKIKHLRIYLKTFNFTINP